MFSRKVHLARDIDLDITVESVWIYISQPELVNVALVSRGAELCYELGDIADSLPSNTFRQTVTEKHPIHVLIRMRPNARRRPLNGSANPRKFSRRTQPRNWPVVSMPKYSTTNANARRK